MEVKYTLVTDDPNVVANAIGHGITSRKIFEGDLVFMPKKSSPNWSHTLLPNADFSYEKQENFTPKRFSASAIKELKISSKKTLSSFEVKKVQDGWKVTLTLPAYSEIPGDMRFARFAKNNNLSELRGYYYDTFMRAVREADLWCDWTLVTA